MKAPGNTATVRVSEELVEAIRKRGRPSTLLGPVLEPWVAEQFRFIPVEIKRLEEAQGLSRQQAAGRPGPAGTIRLPRWQLVRLGIIAAVRGGTVSELVEERAWLWVESLEQDAPDRAVMCAT